MEELSFFAREAGKYFKPKGLDTLILYVTSRCNAKCGFCFYSEELNRVPELSLEQITTISKSLKSLKGLLIGGGEPFLRADLFDVISAFVLNSKTQVVQIPTNGFFTDRIVAFAEKAIAAFPNHNLSIQVSLDALGEKHDELRGLKGAFENAERTVVALSSLKKKNSRLRVLVVSVLSPETIATSRELAAYVRENIKPDYHWFEPVRAMASGNFIVPQDILAFLRDNLKHYLVGIKGTSSSIYASRAFNRMIAAFSLNNFDIAYGNFLSGKSWPVRCCAARRMAVVYPDGTLAACELHDEKVSVQDFGYDVNAALQDGAFDGVRVATAQHTCDCTHGCFVPTSVRYCVPEVAKVFCRSLFR